MREDRKEAVSSQMTLRKVFPLVMLADEISGPFLGTPQSQGELFTPGGYHESR